MLRSRIPTLANGGFSVQVYTISSQTTARLTATAATQSITHGDPLPSNTINCSGFTVYEQKFDTTGTPVGGYLGVPGGLVETLSVGNDPTGNPLLVVLGSDKEIFYKTCDATGTPAAGNYTLTTPGLVNSVTISGATESVRGTDGQLFQSTFSGSAWSPYVLVGQGFFNTYNTSAYTGLTFVIGTDNQIYEAQPTPSLPYLPLTVGQIHPETSIAQDKTGGNAQVFVIGGDSNVYSVRLNANGTTSTGINGGYPIGAGAFPSGLGAKYIIGGQLTGATAALFAIDTSGSIDSLGFTTTGLPAGPWTQTVSSTVTIGL